MSAHARSWPEKERRSDRRGERAAGERGGGAEAPPMEGRGPRRLLHRANAWLRRLLRLRTGIKIDGVYFKELSVIPLSRALSSRGPGQKEYRVTFRDRSKQIIRATPERHYADLCGPARLARYRAAHGRLRPGMRILDAHSGTGYTSAWLAEQVGTYGAVVALEFDEESVEFAQRRYRLPNVAFEVREPSSLDGETNESFDGIVWLTEASRQDAQFLAELWRVLKPGGWLLVGPAPETFAEADLATLTRGAEQDSARANPGSRPGRPEPARARAVIAGRPGGDLLIEKVADPRT